MAHKTYIHDGDCEIPCEEYFYTSCVIYEEPITYLGLEEGSSSTEIIDKLVSLLEYQQDQINDLNEQINTINEQLNTE